MASQMNPFNKNVCTSKSKWYKAWLKGVIFHIKRPIIYFCFGLPILAPSICIILLSTTEESFTSFLIIGSILLAMGMFSVITGIILGVRDLRKNRRFKATEKHATTGVITPSPLPLRSPRNQSLNTSPSPSSRRSSNSSVKTSSNVNISNVDKSKLTTIKKKRMRGGRKRGMKLPPERLPPLTEEESFVKSLSRGNTSSNFKMEHMTKAETNKKHLPLGGSHNLEELKDYLNVIGLGAVPHDNKTSRSFDEKELYGQNSHASVRKVVQTSRDGVVSPTNSVKYPTLVTTSHERTGIRLP